MQTEVWYRIDVRGIGDPFWRRNVMGGSDLADVVKWAEHFAKTHSKVRIVKVTQELERQIGGDDD